MRIGAGDGRVDDLDFTLRQLMGQHPLQDPAETVGRVGGAGGGGFSQNHNAQGIGRFVDRGGKGKRTEAGFAGIKLPEEFVVLDQVGAVEPEAKAGGIAAAGQAQEAFREEETHRDEENGD